LGRKHVGNVVFAAFDLSIYRPGSKKGQPHAQIAQHGRAGGYHSTFKRIPGNDYLVEGFHAPLDLLTTMRQLLYFLAVLLTLGCQGNQATLKAFQSMASKVHFPVKAHLKNPAAFEDDTLLAAVDHMDLILTPTGKLTWGRNSADTLHLQTDQQVERAYFLKTGDSLLVFYTETDHEGATSRLEWIDLNTKRSLHQIEIQGFNLGMPYIVGHFAYVTTIGVVGKIDLDRGDYVYQYFGLYDDKTQAFNSFDTIVFNDSLTWFLSQNKNIQRTDSFWVNEKTGTSTVKH
jgi:hypothetical protein